MKIYRLAQFKQTKQNEQLDPIVAEATQHLATAVANINQSLKVLETSGTAEFFTRDGIIQAIQGGTLSNLNINNVNDALNAMQQISQSALAINNALNAIKTAGHDVGQATITAVTSLNSGDYSAFQGLLAGYQAQLQGMVGTSAL